MSVARSAWLLPRTRRRRHEPLRLESQTAVDRSERKPDRRNTGNDGRAAGWRRFSRPSQNGLDVSGVQVPRSAARPWRSFGFLRYSSRDLKSHGRSLRAASLKPLDIPAAVSVIKRAAALACHRFVTMEWSVSTGDPVARITS